MTRRNLLLHGAGAGFALGVPPLLLGCGSSDADSAPEVSVPLGSYRSTLFFNLAHEQHAGKTYWLTGGGHRQALTPTAEQPHVLREARQGNAFLRAVPDDQITHHVDGAIFVNDTVTLCYVSAEIDAVAGTWSMSSTQLLIPPGAATHAFARATQVPAGVGLPLSAKRKRYGVEPARTAQDLADERVLLDPVSHAQTLVGCHPDLMSLEPASAHTIQSNHIARNSNVIALADELSQRGPALPQAIPGQANASGWATLEPVPGDGDAPLKNTKGRHAGRIQYQPNLQPDLHALAGAAMNASVATVKNDSSLGADITGLTPRLNDPPNAALAGAMWLRHDGLTKIDQSPGMPRAAGGETMVLKDQNGGAFYLVKASSEPSGNAIRVSLTLINFLLQYRGIWLQFLDSRGNVLPLAGIAEYQAGTIIANHDKSADNLTENVMSVSMIGPVFTVLGIPVTPAYSQPAFTVPASASTVRVLSSTMSMQGGNVYPETVLNGAVMTGLFNYGVTALLAAAGGSSFFSAITRRASVLGLQAIALELATLITARLGPGKIDMSSSKFWVGQALVLAKVLVAAVVGGKLAELAAEIALAISAGVAEDSIPVAGQIMQGVSIAVGVINIAETTIELASTPWTYVHDLVFTHDLTVSIFKDSGIPNANPPDPGDDTFPKGANSYTVKAIFDDGTPYTQTMALTAPVPSTLPPVVFKSVPLGGNVNVSVAFVQKSISPDLPDVMLGKASSGAIPNLVDTKPSLTIEEIAFPIGSTTVYQHQQKTALDTSGNHLWATGAAPSVNRGNLPSGAAGTARGWRNITVRQGTGSARGFVGYAWQSQNTDASRAPSCVGGGIGQLDQLANLSTDSGNNGANAQIGYANGACGIGVPGVKIAYSLLPTGGVNFYLDTTDPNAPMVREVTLDSTVAFASPLSGKAWGVLNFASDVFLLHPAGHLVSINNANHKIETLKLPRAALSDSEARQRLLAQPKAGKGSRPGLLDLPVAAAVSTDGVILVLEAGNNRIQAFDLGGNPVRHFNRQNSPNASPYSLRVGGTDPVQGWQYLDLAVEYTGYMYVLSYNQNTFDYRLDIYHPEQADSQPISTTHGINAERLAVDLWRNVYTLNYELLRLPQGAAPGLTEPSVSLWTPCLAKQTCPV
ncbi:MAG: hypothetical protein V4684_19050 [Pseudomonadota bacterium]